MDTDLFIEHFSHPGDLFLITVPRDKEIEIGFLGFCTLCITPEDEGDAICEGIYPVQHFRFIGSFFHECNFFVLFGENEILDRDLPGPDPEDPGFSFEGRCEHEFFLKPFENRLGGPMTQREDRTDLPDIVFPVVPASEERKYTQVILIDVYFFRHMSIFLTHELIGVVDPGNGPDPAGECIGPASIVKVLPGGPGFVQRDQHNPEARGPPTVRSPFWTCELPMIQILPGMAIWAQNGRILFWPGLS